MKSNLAKLLSHDRVTELRIVVNKNADVHEAQITLHIDNDIRHSNLLINLTGIKALSSHQKGNRAEIYQEVFDAVALILETGL